jgi:hypothetical protein
MIMEIRHAVTVQCAECPNKWQTKNVTTRICAECMARAAAAFWAMASKS